MIKSSKPNNDIPLTKNTLMDTLIDFWENIAYPMVNQKADSIKISQQLDTIGSDVRDIKRRLIDLETDTITQTKFTRLEKRVTRLEPPLTN